MTAFFSTAQAVIERTGIGPEDLGFDEGTEEENDDALEAFLEGVLTEVADLIKHKIRRDYLTEFDDGDITSIPAGLTGIAADIASDAIRTMVATRQTPVVRIDDFVVKVIRTFVFSEDVLRRLRLYGSRGIGSIGLTNR